MIYIHAYRQNAHTRKIIIFKIKNNKDLNFATSTHFACSSCLFGIRKSFWHFDCISNRKNTLSHLFCLTCLALPPCTHLQLFRPSPYNKHLSRAPLQKWEVVSGKTQVIQNDKKDRSAHAPTPVIISRKLDLWSWSSLSVPSQLPRTPVTCVLVTTQQPVSISPSPLHTSACEHTMIRYLCQSSLQKKVWGLQFQGLEPVTITWGVWPADMVLEQ